MMLDIGGREDSRYGGAGCRKILETPIIGEQKRESLYLICGAGYVFPRPTSYQSGFVDKSSNSFFM